MKLIVTMTKTEYVLKEGTKTVFVESAKEVSDLTEEQYNNIVGSCSWFRKLGGSETVQRGYTCAGYRPTKITSKNPDRDVEVIREFTFKYLLEDGSVYAE